MQQGWTLLHLPVEDTLYHAAGSDTHTLTCGGYTISCSMVRHTEDTLYHAAWSDTHTLNCGGYTISYNIVSCNDQGKIYFIM